MGVVDAVNETLDALASTLGENPALAVGLVAVLFVLAVAGWLVVRRLRLTKGERFARVLGRKQSLAVLMHPNPDPDAMSCALAVEELAENRETETTLYYPGQIRHHENRAFETVLDVTFDRIESEADIDETDVMLVDHNEPRGFSGAESIDPIAVIDHHPGDGTGTEFTDVRTDNGACATLFSEYFEHLGWEPLGPDEIDTVDTTDGILSPRTSTGLVYGIQSDTKQLTKGCSAAEFDAAAFLYDGIDEDKLDRIANPDIDAESLSVKARAITERDVRGAFAISDVGTVSNVDAIPQAADELRRLEGVNAVVVLGDKDGTIHLSGRSTDDRVHMGKVLDAAVEDIPMAGAGGHARMGGGQCSIEHMKGLGPGDGLTHEEFKERLFDAMNGEL
jgi:nanoRNase/pAp phosphatase (c-di-AMP/oligoRNAs hydrolase)